MSGGEERDLDGDCQPLTIEEGCDDEFAVLLDQVVDVAKDSTGSVSKSVKPRRDERRAYHMMGNNNRVLGGK